MFATHDLHTFTFPTLDADRAVTQSCLGWRQGGCDIVWSDHLPRVLAAHGSAMCGGKTVLELGAGCGLVGLIAAQFASRVDITDGDPEEVDLIQMNVEAHAPAGGAVVSAQFLEWGSAPAAEARSSGALLAGGYDVILAAQVPSHASHQTRALLSPAEASLRVASRRWCMSRRTLPSSSRRWRGC